MGENLVNTQAEETIIEIEKDSESGEIKGVPLKGKEHTVRLKKKNRLKIGAHRGTVNLCPIILRIRSRYFCLFTKE